MNFRRHEAGALLQPSRPQQEQQQVYRRQGMTGTLCIRRPNDRGGLELSQRDVMCSKVSCMQQEVISTIHDSRDEGT